jgi:hypothetical protein
MSMVYVFDGLFESNGKEQTNGDRPNATDGKMVAQGNPNAKLQLGQDQRTLTDSTGKNFGKEVFAAGQKPEGQITKVSYMFARPGADTTPVAKVSLVTRVSDLVCGVGYYK